MNKIGLYLSGSRLDGGGFQYSQSLLEAAVSLPRDEFQLIVAFDSEDWKDEQSDVTRYAQHWPARFLDKLPPYVWERARLPVGMWRKLAPWVHGFSARFVREQCRLWLFSGPTYWAYRIPVATVCVIHDLMHRYESRFPEAGNFADGRDRLNSRVCRWAEGILVDSELGRQQLCESYSISKRKVMPLPFVAPSHSMRGVQTVDIRSKYALPDKFFFYPAQFWEHKNHKILLRATKRICATVPDLHLVFVGGRKNGYESTITLARELGVSDRVTITGYIPDEEMGSFYRAARALLMPTFFGPTNIPPLEAMAVGCPVAVSNIYAMPEQVGKAGLLFDPKSEEQVSDVMIRLWTDDELCKKLIEAGKRRAAEWNQTHFNVRFNDILRHICAGLCVNNPQPKNN